MGCLFKTCADSCSETEIVDTSSKDNEWHWMTPEGHYDNTTKKGAFVFLHLFWSAIVILPLFF